MKYLSVLDRVLDAAFFGLAWLGLAAIFAAPATVAVLAGYRAVWGFALAAAGLYLWLVTRPEGRR